MLQADFRAAALPLFEAGAIEALEWSFDIEWSRADCGLEPLPPWAGELLDHYAAADRLFGHGVTFSPGSGMPILVGSYHPSRQNTQTGKLTVTMFNDVFRRVKRLGGAG